MKTVYIPHLLQDTIMYDYLQENIVNSDCKSYSPIVRTIENWASLRHWAMAYHFYLKCHLGSWGSPKLIQGGCKVKITFIVILKFYLLFSISLSHECLVEFSGGYIVCDISEIECKSRYENPAGFSKPDLKEIFKNIKQCHSPSKFLEMQLFFIKYYVNIYF